ncbi:MAG TPA: hypothetical protein DD381_02900 [Lentisphaeria bacterium]|nr:MAG: hypothetical protein A2X47_03350 [Lentisphaerae bacterium GWF2_38_69]HBM15281.1 hypothetical protein [Lentisphaeria bacterium]
MDLIASFKNTITLFSEGKIDYPELKKTSSKLGIYKQKDGKFMSRIRIPGGEISIEKLKIVSALSKEFEVDYIHFTTRADIQLHGVEASKLPALIDKYRKNSLGFYGGGGNCIRAAMASSHSGVHQNSIFDVVPYAQEVEKIFEKFETTASLPRKIKIGFSCYSDDCDNAVYQDMGFVAKLIDGKKCFDVYVGGTLGKTPFRGIKILDSMPVENYLSALFAVMNLFHEHGNYQDRNKARIKFIVEAKGEKEFNKLFMSYYSSMNKIQSAVLHERSEFAAQFNGKLITIYIPYGICSSDELDIIIKLLEEYKVNFIRLTRERNIILSLKEEAVYDFYLALKQLGKNYTGESFKGLITTCIGGKVCDVGITDSLKFGDAAAEILDEYFSQHPEQKKSLFKKILKSIKISGCPNSCGYNKIAKLGLSGVKSKNEKGESVEMCRFATLNTEFAYSEALKNKPLSKDELSQIIGELVSNLLK